MYEKELPFGEPIFFQGEYKHDKVYSLYIQMITCSFKLKKNKIPTIQIKNNRSFFKANEYLENSQNEIVCLVLTNVDLKLFFEQYDVYDLEYVCGSLRQFKEFLKNTLTNGLQEKMKQLFQETKVKELLQN